MYLLLLLLWCWCIAIGCGVATTAALVHEETEETKKNGKQINMYLVGENTESEVGKIVESKEKLERPRKQ